MRLPLPFHTVTTLTHFWGTDRANLVLQEPVLEWLEQHDMRFKIEYVELGIDVDYFIVFEREDAAMWFKMRWF